MCFIFVCLCGLTLRRAQASGCRDHGQRGAAVHRAQVVLHVRVDVRVRRAEGRVPGRHGGRREADQGDIRDDGAAGQTCGAARDKKTDGWM